MTAEVLKSVWDNHGIYLVSLGLLECCWGDLGKDDHDWQSVEASGPQMKCTHL